MDKQQVFALIAVMVAMALVYVTYKPVEPKRFFIDFSNHGSR